MQPPDLRLRLKLAIDLERQVRDPVPPRIWPPLYAWEHYVATLRRMNYCQQAGFHRARDFTQSEFLRASGSLVEHLGQVLSSVRLQSQPQHRASLRDILDDITSLFDDFPEVRWDRMGKTLHVVTEPVVLEGVPLGRFAIVLEFNHLRQAKPYRVVPLDPHPAAGDDTTPHPHVRDEDLCEGDGRPAIRTALAQGRFADFFQLIHRILTTYNPNSAYIPLSRWEGVRCPDCGSTVDSDEMSVCDDCHADVCGDCVGCCSRCYGSLCGKCQERCHACEETCCRGCLKGCSGCSHDHCGSCLEVGCCAACQELHDDDHDEDPTPPPETAVPAHPAVQPDGVGQAPVPAGSGIDRDRGIRDLDAG